MDKFYKILFIIVIAFTIIIVGYTFNKTIIENDFVMIEDEETENEDMMSTQPLEEAGI